MNNSDTSPTEPTVDNLADIDPAFHAIVQQYGRSMFALVMNAGMAGQAAQVLSNLVNKHQSQHSAHALNVLVQAFNQVSNSYTQQMTWPEELVAQCDRDIQLAFRTKLLLPGHSPNTLDS